MKPPPGFTLDPDVSPPPGFTLDAPELTRPATRPIPPAPSLGRPRDPRGLESPLPGIGVWMQDALTSPPDAEHPPFDPPVNYDWPHQPYDPHGIDFPRETGIWSGIKSRAVDLAKGFVTAGDIPARALTKMEADIAGPKTMLPLHGFGLGTGSPMGAVLKPPSVPTNPNPQPNYSITELENIKREIAYKPKISWAEVKQSSNPLDWGRFILQEGLTSTPDMAAVLISTPAYIWARAGDLAEERAKNQGRTVPNAEDLAWSIPTAAASAGMERIGARGMLFGKGATPAGRIAKAGAKEAATEAGQEAVEYTGTTADTKKPFRVSDMLDQMAAGAVAGGPFGAGVRSAIEGIGAVARPSTPDTGPIRSAIANLSPYSPGAVSLPPSSMLPAPVSAPIPYAGRPGAPAWPFDFTDRPEFSQQSLRSDGWKAEIDLQGAAPRVYGNITRHVNVTAPDGRVFSVPVDIRDGMIGDDPATISVIRSRAIGDVQRRLAQGYEPTAPEFAPWVPEADRTAMARNYEREREAYAKGPIPSSAPPRQKASPPAEMPTGVPSVTLQPKSPAKASPIDAATSSVERLAPSPIFTPAGRKVDVAYELVSLDSLIPSHTDDLRLNPAFPQELQPRDRERAASEAQIVDISSRLEPARLGRSSDTSSGAPIVGPDNVVESGNGRALALRRAYDRNPERAEAYKAWLRAQGLNVEGIARPVLIARRISNLSPQERVEFAREANAASTLRMSAGETAKADAEAVKKIIDQFRGGDVTFAQNAGFVRAFLNSIPTSERGALWTEQGGLSQDGARRIQAAILQAAYDDSALVSKAFESANNDIRAIAGALLDVAPAWAQMRNRVAKGEISKDLDRTKDLIGAVRAVEEARRKGLRPDDVFNQGGLFGNLDAARDFGALFFNNDKMTQPASRQTVAGRLKKYVEQANKADAGPNLFGQAPTSASDILNSAKISVPEGFTLDEPGMLRSGLDPTGLASFYSRQAQKVLDFIHEKGAYKLAPLRNLPREPEYLAKRYETLGKLAEIDKIAHQIFKAFRGLTKVQRNEVHAYMTTRGADPASISNARVRPEAVKAKAMIESVGRALVSRGLLSEEVFELHRGEYLPRVYLKHLLGDRIGSGRAKLDLGYLKQRQDIPWDVRRLILGEITDPGYLTARGYNVPMRDMALVDFLEQLSQDNDWVLKDSFVTWEGQRVSASWLWHEAQRLRTMAEHAEPSDRPEILEIAVRMERTARPGLSVERADGFKQVPDSPKYGKLRGIWIRKEIWDDLFGNMGFLVDDPSFAEKVLGQRGHVSRATQLWKMFKVPLNIPTVVRNFVGNIMLLQMSGVPLVRLPDRMIQAMIEMGTNGRHWQAAKKYGVTNTNFAHNELYRLDRFARSVMHLSGKPATRLAAIAGGLLDKAAGFYGLLEGIAKTAKMIDAMEREGMSAEKAALEAHKWIFDYSLIPPTVRYLRNAPVGMPFVTFNYKVAPRLLEVAAKHPWRLWPYVAAATLMPLAAMDGLDIDEEEYKALKKSLPKWMRDRGHVFILPWRDEFGRFQAVDVSAFMPWNFFQEVGGEFARGDIGGAVQKSGFGGPFSQVISALYTNVDPFTGREISNKADPYGKRLRDELLYAFRMMVPSWLSDEGAAARMAGSLEGRLDKRTGQPGSTFEQSASRLFGANTYPVDPQQTRAQNIQAMSRELRDIQRRMGQVLFDRNLSPAQREAQRQVYMEHYREKAREIQEYARDTLKAPRVKAPAK